MFRKAGCALVLSLVSLIAWSQPLQGYAGTWSATWTGGKSGKDFEADLKLGPDGGTWHRLGGNRRDVCAAIDYPVKVESASDDSLVLDVKGSQALGGCPDFKLRLRKAADGSLEGTFGGGPLKLVRK